MPEKTVARMSYHQSCCKSSVFEKEMFEDDVRLSAFVGRKLLICQLGKNEITARIAIAVGVLKALSPNLSAFFNSLVFDIGGFTASLKDGIVFVAWGVAEALNLFRFNRALSPPAKSYRGIAMICQYALT